MWITIEFLFYLHPPLYPYVCMYVFFLSIHSPCLLSRDRLSAVYIQKPVPFLVYLCLYLVCVYCSGRVGVWWGMEVAVQSSHPPSPFPSFLPSFLPLRLGLYVYVLQLCLPEAWVQVVESESQSGDEVRVIECVVSSIVQWWKVVILNEWHGVRGNVISLCPSIWYVECRKSRICHSTLLLMEMWKVMLSL